MSTNTNIINIGIDADSLVHKACYRHQIDDGTSVDIELAYLEFCYEIGKVKSAIYRILKYEKGDKIVPLIILSPRKSFRNEINPMYKANRKPSNIHGIKQLKYMIMDRLKNVSMVVPKVEADDVVIYYANKYDYMISAIDKDVLHASPTSCYDYNKRRWENPRMDFEIEEWYWIQALMGDTIDNIKGAKGIGEVGARKHMNEYGFEWQPYVELFEDEYEAILSMQQVRMDQLIEVDGKLQIKLWLPEQSDYVH